ncbi:MAG: peptidoglycan synthetase [Chitinophagales bacterium]|nr:peptidoglycan synthetase [Chitinophagales bacterium]
MKIYFIAIGGSVMHNLAIALKMKGYEVQGSDDEIIEPARSNLSKYNLLPETEGWNENRITENIDAVILGMHAKPENPELLKAVDLGLKIYSYPEFLYEQAKNKTRIVIAGSHGKTSITAMILHILKKNNIDADYMIGAALPGYELTVRLTEKAPIIILEGDEYPDSTLNQQPKFLVYRPHLALISGISWDHINVFPTFENYVEQFEKFASLIPVNGTIIYNNEDSQVADIVSNLKSNIHKIPYYTPSFKIDKHQTFFIDRNQEIPLQIFGKHNLQNLAGAIEVCKALGISEDKCLASIGDFRGAAKRLELLDQNNEAAVFKDFAHSPSKLKATIAAVKEQFPDRRLIACFELHTYSSLNSIFIKEYEGTMKEADIKIIFFNEHTFNLKQLVPYDPDFVRESFGDSSIQVITDTNVLDEYLRSVKWKKSNLLMMSSGNFGGLDFKELSTFVMKNV